MSKDKLTPEDKAVINDFSIRFEAGLDAIEKAKQLKIGDYLILYVSNYDKLELQRNSYGAPVKYKVVHTTKHGLPFVKKVNKKGVPMGQLYSCMGMLENDDFAHGGGKFQFELDPDYADSLLLEDKYDPATLHKSKRDIWKAVTDHNKANKINTHDINSIVQFFHTLNPGDTIWTSNSSHFTVRDKKAITKMDAQKIIRSVPHHKVKGPMVLVLTVVDKKGKVIDIAADFFYYKALYKARPRSYSELKI